MLTGWCVWRRGRGRKVWRRGRGRVWPFAGRGAEVFSLVTRVAAEIDVVCFAGEERGAYRDCAQSEIHFEELFRTISMSGMSSVGVGVSTLGVMSFAARSGAKRVT